MDVTVEVGAIKYKLRSDLVRQIMRLPGFKAELVYQVTKKWTEILRQARRVEEGRAAP